MAPALVAPVARRPVRRALFVDRDGTLNPDLHYLKEADRLELFGGVGNALRLAHDHGFLLVCVTNQSGVGRGLYAAADVDAVHDRLNRLLRPHRVQIDAFYYCPHTPEEDCRCRKPKTGLFEDAQRDWNLDFAGSAIIGDRGIDVVAGRRLGLLTALVAPPGHQSSVDAEMKELGTYAEIRADAFASAGARILARG
jgi:histidinol-phosphate phosphatase family protein